MGVSTEVPLVKVVTPRSQTASQKQVVKVPYWATELSLDYGYLNNVAIRLNDVEQTITLRHERDEIVVSTTIDVGDFIKRFDEVVNILTCGHTMTGKTLPREN